MLWTDKYNPTTFKELDYHEKLTETLKKLANPDIVTTLPHLIFNGPIGSGKRTRIMCLLREIYNKSINNAKITEMSFKVNNRKVELQYNNSIGHIEINPSDVGNYDRHIIIKLIEKAEFVNFHLSNKIKFKIIVINDADKLSKQAQHSLRMTMEKHVDRFRFILCCKSVSKIADPLRSRCLQINVPAPSINEITNILKKIMNNEELEINDNILEEIAKISENNLRRSIMIFEQYINSNDNKIRIPDWELCIKNLEDLVNEKTPNAVIKSRSILYNLLTNCIDGSIIIKKLAFILFERQYNINNNDNDKNSKKKSDIIYWASYYEKEMVNSQNPIYYIEAFIVKMMII